MKMKRKNKVDTIYMTENSFESLEYERYSKYDRELF